MKYSGIGGQAVMEGVMMKNKDHYAVAVRKPDGNIEVKKEEFKGISSKCKLFRVPFIRGIFSFIDSLTLGMSTLTYSASFYDEEEDTKKTEQEKKKSDTVFNVITIMISVRCSRASLPQGVRADGAPGFDGRRQYCLSPCAA